MSVSLDDVRHVAALARLGLSADRASALVAELNTILGHMDVLSKVDTSGIEPVAGIGAAGAPLRPDAGPAVQLARGIEEFAPRTADGFFLVPRLSTHEDPEEA
ncbi:MAG TPA: Asp-tRNA(Asn)/Glu-tRNA(Gln) amidotransferase subunit GatC [Gemmatimonadaceae bacterium]|nr:Asp-tRNA(Asn)/Glu-tRNA(Gln) amidotransferase subunit GatC [Gemmatimonadaceae bacterium]